MTNKEAINHIEDMANALQIFPDSKQGQALLMAIKALSAVSKTGHWITTRTLMHDGEYYCDKCDHSSPYNNKWDYCPNCGAKMESEE